MNKIRVLVVDDSAYMRHKIAQILSSDHEMELVGEAKNGNDAILKISTLKPDCVTLDMEMPELDGLGTLQIVMKENPLPVILLTVLSKNNEKVIKALEMGAVDFLHKPDSAATENDTRENLIAKIKAAFRVPAHKLKKQSFTTRVQTFTGKPKMGVIAIASSTGGPGALNQIIPYLPEGFPVPVIVIQHFPENFTSFLAQRLNQASRLRVKEAEDGEEIQGGNIYIGKGGWQMRVKEDKGRKIFKLTREHSPHKVAPSADFTFEDLAQLYGKQCMVVVLTGMGEDGLLGARAVKGKGGIVISQDEASSLIYGMPRAVAENKLTDKVFSLCEITDNIVRMAYNG